MAGSVKVRATTTSIASFHSRAKPPPQFVDPRNALHFRIPPCQTIINSRNVMRLCRSWQKIKTETGHPPPIPLKIRFLRRLDGLRQLFNTASILQSQRQSQSQRLINTLNLVECSRSSQICGLVLYSVRISVIGSLRRIPKNLLFFNF
jgi:hypothetical protein